MAATLEPTVEKIIEEIRPAARHLVAPLLRTELDRLAVALLDPERLAHLGNGRGPEARVNWKAATTAQDATAVPGQGFDPPAQKRRKRCNVCQEEKAIQAFAKRRGTCRSCRSRQERERAQRRRERIRHTSTAVEDASEEPGLASHRLGRIMRLLLALAAAVVALAFAGVAQAGYACWGAPPDYVQAFDQVRGQKKDGQVMYPHKTIYVEGQGWITPNDGVSEPGHHSEHGHAGACFPFGMTWLQANGARVLDYKFTFHNMRDYAVSAVGGSFVDLNTLGGGLIVTPEQLQGLSFAASISRDTTVTAFQSYGMKPVGSNGLKEFRTGLHLVRSGPEALVDVWRISSRWWSYFNYPGLPSAPPKAQKHLQTQNWVEWTINGVKKEDYNYGGFANVGDVWKVGSMAAPKPAVWTVPFLATDGTDAGSLEIDPDHHRHPDFNGIWSQSFTFNPTQSTTVQVDIPLDRIVAEHKLVTISHAHPEAPVSVKPISTAVNVIPFQR